MVYEYPSKVTKKKVLSDLPSSINVASVLEDYVRHYSAICLVNYEKQVSKTYYTANRKESSRELFSKVMTNINLAKEIADGLRVMFDFNLRSVLLYGSHGEVKQYNEVMKPGKLKKNTAKIFPEIKLPPSRRQSSVRESVSSSIHGEPTIFEESFPLLPASNWNRFWPVFSNI